MKRFTQLTTAGLLATSLLLTGCASDWDQRMQAIKADPMATATWDGFELLETYETTNDSYKSPGPRVTSCYKTSIPSEEAITAVVSAASTHGWSEVTDMRSPGNASADKTVTYGLSQHAHLTLNIAAGKNLWCERTQDANLRISISNS